jgi:hypothetical protein
MLLMIKIRCIQFSNPIPTYGDNCYDRILLWNFIANFDNHIVIPFEGKISDHVALICNIDIVSSEKSLDSKHPNNPPKCNII